MLVSSEIKTPIGHMIAIADEQSLHILEFTERVKSNHPSGSNKILDSIKHELNLYFSGQLKKFNTPLYLNGTDFQKTVWQALIKIPFGETCSYGDLAKTINKPTAFRAAALANSKNKLAIIIPCHRVINSNGKLGGYASGVDRKAWLLEHEKNPSSP
jgi:AraC family transcriptional regulator of adaptative response/methylated-DNA-[protein]-cysteine methyltransferase